jgi:hypothetical protein
MRKQKNPGDLGLSAFLPRYCRVRQNSSRAGYPLFLITKHHHIQRLFSSIIHPTDEYIRGAAGAFEWLVFIPEVGIKGRLGLSGTQDAFRGAPAG